MTRSTVLKSWDSAKDCISLSWTVAVMHLTAVVCQVYSPENKILFPEKSLYPQLVYWKEYKDIIGWNKHKKCGNT